ncbi:ImmA/IrrE family metallo-endopeptidase, partial [Rhizobium leguminosarum]|uniref:ImmA/IrrE family metallo-endopeptidase n=1 Tax=Rhizobium leguminosarum TaxID=384 RepID=UPI003F9A0DDC
STLAHELIHVKFHKVLWELYWAEGRADKRAASCHRDTILTAGTTDWLEWQAGYGSGAILMPKVNLIEDLKKMSFDLKDWREDSEAGKKA